MNYDYNPSAPSIEAFVAHMKRQQVSIEADDDPDAAPAPAPARLPTFSEMLDMIEQRIADPMLEEIFIQRFQSRFANIRPKPNLAAFPIDFATLEVSVWDNEPFNKWKKSTDKERAPVRFNVSVKASRQANRNPLNKPDWIANVCELRSPKEFGKMVRNRWKLVGAEREIADDLAQHEGVLIGRMKIKQKGKGIGGEHFHDGHFVVLPEAAMMQRQLEQAVIITPGGNVRVGEFSTTLAGGDSFPINDRLNGNKSCVILQSRHSTRPNLTAWSSGTSSIVEA